MKEDEAAIYDFCTELHEKKARQRRRVPGGARALRRAGVVDLIGVSGYYTLVSMVLNVDRHPLPAEPRPR